MAKMVCSVCGHKKREGIDKAIVNGVPIRKIAVEFEASPAAVQRHKTHLSRNLVKAMARAHDIKSADPKEVFRELARGDSLLEDVRSREARAERLYGVAESILEEAREAKDRKTALDAIRAAVNIMAEARQYLELRGELTGELSKIGPPSINVTLIRTLTVPRPPATEACRAVPIVVDAVKRLDS